MKKVILHVGHTGTPGDTSRICRVFDWIIKRVPHTLNEELEPQFMDLSKGQDFLTDKGTYEMIVLHYLCRDHRWFKMTKSVPPEMRVSEHSSWVAWRRRLVDSKAKYLFLFGGMFEVGGSYIVTLDGYTWEQVEEEFWVFTNLCAEHTTGPKTGPQQKEAKP